MWKQKTGMRPNLRIGTTGHSREHNVQNLSEICFEMHMISSEDFGKSRCVFRGVVVIFLIIQGPFKFWFYFCAWCHDSWVYDQRERLIYI